MRDLLISLKTPGLAALGALLGLRWAFRLQPAKAAQSVRNELLAVGPAL